MSTGVDNVGHPSWAERFGLSFPLSNFMANQGSCSFYKNSVQFQFMYLRVFQELSAKFCFFFFFSLLSGFFFCVKCYIKVYWDLIIRGYTLIVDTNGNGVVNIFGKSIWEFTGNGRCSHEYRNLGSQREGGSALHLLHSFIFP